MAMILLIQKIPESFNLQHAKATIFCDNAKAIRNKPIQNQTYAKLTKRDIDWIIEIRHILDNIRAKITLSTVEGHQADRSEFNYSTALQEAQRNIDMDN